MLTSYIHTLQKETERDVRKIESSEAEIISRALAVSLLLEKVFDKLKRFISTYEFQSEADEIEFFKEIKPRIFCKLIYYRKIYNIEMNRPVSGPDSVKAYLNRELDNIQDYNHKRLDFYRYYRSGASYLDNVYFLRNISHNIEQYFDSFYFERDPLFSTCGDFRVAKILAGDMLSQYLLNALNELEMSNFDSRSPDLGGQQNRSMRVDICPACKRFFRQYSVDKTIVLFSEGFQY